MSIGAASSTVADRAIVGVDKQPDPPHPGRGTAAHNAAARAGRHGARARRVEDKAEIRGAALDRGGDRLLARQPANLGGDGITEIWALRAVARRPGLCALSAVHAWISSAQALGIVGAARWRIFWWSAPVPFGLTMAAELARHRRSAAVSSTGCRVRCLIAGQSASPRARRSVGRHGAGPRDDRRRALD